MKKNTKKFFSSLGAIAVIIIFISGYSVKASTDVKHWNDRFYPGTYIENIDLGGKTKEEAKKIIEDNYVKGFSNKVIKINTGDEVKEIEVSTLNPVFNIEATINKAYTNGKSGNLITRFIKVKKAKKVNYEINYEIDKAKIKELIDKLKKEADLPAEDAKIKRENGVFKFTKEMDGRNLNTKKLATDIEKAIGNIRTQEISVKGEFEEVKPKITEEQLSEIDTKIASFSTHFSTSNEGRASNIALATKGLNGKVIMPGEEFSFNKVLGDRTAKKGYKSAGVIVGDRLEQGIGGGICQVSTTLYNSVIKLNVRITERHNHSLPIHYVAIGTDAAVSYGALDLRFINTLEFPIYIEGIVAYGNVQFNIYSNYSAVDANTSYILTSEILKVIPPVITYVEDETLLPGESEIVANGTDGYNTVTYINKVVDGEVASKKMISKDTYYSTNTKIAVGKEGE